MSISLARGFARAVIRVYQLTASAFVGRQCRHLPTCSDYADEAIERYGVWIGCWMALARLCRCQPFGTHGLDFVPRKTPSHARWYLPWRYGRWRSCWTEADPGMVKPG